MPGTRATLIPKRNATISNVSWSIPEPMLAAEALAIGFSGTKMGRDLRNKSQYPQSGAAVEHAGANVCPTDLQVDRVSAFLLQFSGGAKTGEVKFALAQLPDVKIVEASNVLTSSRQALSSLLIGIAVFTVSQLTALLILVSLLFPAIVQERYREIG